MELLRLLERGVEALALLGEHVEDDRVVAALSKLQRLDEQRQIVAVNRAEVAHTEFLENEAAAETAAAIIVGARGIVAERDFLHDALHGLLDLLADLVGDFPARHPAHEGLKVLLERVVGGVGDELVEVAGNRADVLGDGPLVVVEDADELLGRVRDVVQRLEGHAVGQRGVAKDTDDVLVALTLVTRGAHPEGGRERRARMACAEAVVLGLRAEREAVQAVGLADGVEAVLAAREQLVDIDLMAHIPDEFVLRRAEDAVQCDGEFHHAEVRAEMAAGLGELGDELTTDVCRE